MADTSASGIDRQMGAPRVYDAVFTDKKDNATVKPSDFLNLMIAQMRNQDFLNPMDDTQFVTQMAQFSTMQQMMELAEYSKTNYAMSLVGKTVTASRFNVSGGLDTATGVVNRISLLDNEYILYIDGHSNGYTLAQIMEVLATAPSAPAEEKPLEEKAADPLEISLQAAEATADAAIVFWQAPTNDAAAAGQLKYTIYYSETGPFDTLELVKSGMVAGQPEQLGITAGVVPGLKPDTQYFINVIVKDAEGVERVYQPVSVTTIAPEPPKAAVLPETDELEEEDENPEMGETPEEGEIGETEEGPEMGETPEISETPEASETPETEPAEAEPLP